jgi:hypothetical protein
MIIKVQEDKENSQKALYSWVSPYYRIIKLCHILEGKEEKNEKLQKPYGHT